MENIIEPNDSFDFSKLSLAHPTGIQGGAYFTKIEFNKKPLYIQTFKSLTRQGFVKTGKKYYCDLMFDKNSETLIHWFENLEERCHKLIYEKKDAWFQGNLEESDIETAFTPLIRIYKSGKYYLLRTNIKNNKDDIPAVKIYNEKEITLNINDITPETEIISILDIQGIKFTSRNFQIEIELKQIMVLDSDPIFDSCLIKTNKKNDKPLEEFIQPVSLQESSIDEQPLNGDLNNLIGEIKIEQPVVEKNEPNILETLDTLEDILQTDEPKEENISIEFEDLIEDIEENNDDLREINNDD